MALNFVVKNIGSRGKEFHGNAQISKSGCEMFNRPVTEPYASIAHDHGDIVANMVTQLMRINGVEELFVNPYAVTVYMAEAFKWNKEVDKIVEQAFYKALVAQDEDQKNLKIVIESFPNKFIKDFNTNFEVSRSFREEFQRPLRLSSVEYLQRVGIDNGGELVRLIFNIDGVTRVIVRPYEVSVEIGSAFNWNGIEPAIIRCFEIIFGPIAEVVNK